MTKVWASRLANAYGHETGIAEYIIGAMIALTRSFGCLDARLRQGQWESQWAVGMAAPPLWPELAGETLGILGSVTELREAQVDHGRGEMGEAHPTTAGFVATEGDPSAAVGSTPWTRTDPPPDRAVSDRHTLIRRRQYPLAQILRIRLATLPKHLAGWFA